MIPLETQLNTALAEVDRLKQENAGLKAAIHDMRIKAATNERAKILGEAALPAASIARLNEAFANSTDNAGLKQAINAERRHAQTMSKQDLRVERILG